MATIIILGTLASIEWILSPRLDKTSEGDILLWYNIIGGRDYIIIWEEN